MQASYVAATGKTAATQADGRSTGTGGTGAVDALSGVSAACLAGLRAPCAAPPGVHAVPAVHTSPELPRDHHPGLQARTTDGAALSLTAASTTSTIGGATSSAISATQFTGSGRAEAGLDGEG